MFVGIGHRKRVGKDALASLLVAELRKLGVLCRKTSLAEPLKRLAFRTFKWSGLQPGAYYEQEEHAAEREIVLPKIGLTPRQIWNVFGTGVARQIHPDTWVHSFFDQEFQGSEVVIVPDVRFPNEAEAIKARGGILIKVEWDKIPPSDSSIDHVLDDYQGWQIIFNNGSWEWMTKFANATARGIALSLGKQPPRILEKMSESLR